MTSTEERLGELERRCAQAEAVQAALEARCAQMALAVQELTAGLATRGAEKLALIQHLQDKFREVEELPAGGQQGRAAWRDWSFAFKRCAHAARPPAGAGAHPEALPARMDAFAEKDAAVPTAEQSATDRAFGLELSAMLALVLTGGALQKLQDHPESNNGLDMWRVLSSEHDPPVEDRREEPVEDGREEQAEDRPEERVEDRPGAAPSEQIALGFLEQILDYKFLGQAEREFEAFDALVKRFEDESEDRVADSILRATVVKGLPDGGLLDYLRRNHRSFTTYPDMRAAIALYFHLSRAHAADSPQPPPSGPPGGSGEGGGGADKGKCKPE